LAYLRKNAWKLGTPWAPELLWYARAVKVMKSRALNDRLSWRYYAAIHGFNASQWAAVGEPSTSAQRPPAAEQKTFWNQCQHGSWYFLPWHRGYLMAFEKVVRDAMATLPGAPTDWALPYWNYLDPGENKLPAEFAAPAWPDGTNDNPLFETVRYGPDNNGVVFVELTGQYAVEETTALAEGQFVGADDGGSHGFGGPQTDAFTHSGGHHGMLESKPHDMVHVNVGGTQKSGLMSDPITAGLDPIFWLHHANIDRLWEVWKRLPVAQGDPTSNKWKGGPPNRDFVMPLPGSAATWTFTRAIVENLAALDYSYDDLTAPAQPAPAALRLETLGAKPEEALAMLQEVRTVPRTVEAVGASAVGLNLVGSSAHTQVALNREAAGRLVQSFAAMPQSAPNRVFLNLENVRAARDGAVLSVYVNLPAGADPASHPEFKAGSVALFGARAASEPDGEHAGDGLTFSLDITPIVDRLHLAGGLGDAPLDVSIVSRAPIPADDKVTIGRVGVYRQQG
jgi:tyrosinase